MPDMISEISEYMSNRMWEHMKYNYVRLSEIQVSQYMWIKVSNIMSEYMWVTVSNKYFRKKCRIECQQIICQIICQTACQKIWHIYIYILARSKRKTQNECSGTRVPNARVLAPEASQSFFSPCKKDPLCHIEFFNCFSKPFLTSVNSSTLKFVQGLNFSLSEKKGSGKET